MPLSPPRGTTLKEEPIEVDLDDTTVLGCPLTAKKEPTKDTTASHVGKSSYHLGTGILPPDGGALAAVKMPLSLPGGTTIKEEPKEFVLDDKTVLGCSRTVKEEPATDTTASPEGESCGLIPPIEIQPGADIPLSDGNGPSAAVEMPLSPPGVMIIKEESVDVEVGQTVCNSISSTLTHGPVITPEALFLKGALEDVKEELPARVGIKQSCDSDQPIITGEAPTRGVVTYVTHASQVNDMATVTDTVEGVQCITPMLALNGQGQLLSHCDPMNVIIPGNAVNNILPASNVTSQLVTPILISLPGNSLMPNLITAPSIAGQTNVVLNVLPTSATVNQHASTAGIPLSPHSVTVIPNQVPLFVNGQTLLLTSNPVLVQNPFNAAASASMGQTLTMPPSVAHNGPSPLDVAINSKLVPNQFSQSGIMGQTHIASSSPEADRQLSTNVDKQAITANNMLGENMGFVKVSCESPISITEQKSMRDIGGCAERPLLEGTSQLQTGENVTSLKLPGQETQQAIMGKKILTNTSKIKQCLSTKSIIPLMPPKTEVPNLSTLGEAVRTMSSHSTHHVATRWKSRKANARFEGCPSSKSITPLTPPVDLQSIQPGTSISKTTFQPDTISEVRKELLDHCYALKPESEDCPFADVTTLEEHATESVFAGSVTFEKTFQNIGALDDSNDRNGGSYHEDYYSPENEGDGEDFSPDECDPSVDGPKFFQCERTGDMIKVEPLKEKKPTKRKHKDKKSTIRKKYVGTSRPVVVVEEPIQNSAALENADDTESDSYDDDYYSPEDEANRDDFSSDEYDPKVDCPSFLKRERSGDKNKEEKSQKRECKEKKPKIQKKRVRAPRARKLTWEFMETSFSCKMCGFKTDSVETICGHHLRDHPELVVTLREFLSKTKVGHEGIDETLYDFMFGRGPTSSAKEDVVKVLDNRGAELSSNVDRNLVGNGTTPHKEQHASHFMGGDTLEEDAMLDNECTKHSTAVANKRTLHESTGDLLGDVSTPHHNDREMAEEKGKMPLSGDSREGVEQGSKSDNEGRDILENERTVSTSKAVENVLQKRGATLVSTCDRGDLGNDSSTLPRSECDIGIPGKESNTPVSQCDGVIYENEVGICSSKDSETMHGDKGAVHTPEANMEMTDGRVHVGKCGKEEIGGTGHGNDRHKIIMNTAGLYPIIFTYTSVKFCCPYCKRDRHKHCNSLNFVHCCNRPQKRLCEKCGVTFSRDYFPKHLELHHGAIKYTAQCHLCGKKMGSRVLADHMSRAHSEKKKLTCNICGKSLSRSQLVYHQRIHMKVYPFKCTVCQKGFAQKTNLSTHMRQHTGERPYKCDECSKSFTNNVCLKTHLKRYHGIDLWKLGHTGGGRPKTKNVSAAKEENETTEVGNDPSNCRNARRRRSNRNDSSSRERVISISKMKNNQTEEENVTSQKEIYSSRGKTGTSKAKSDRGVRPKKCNLPSKDIIDSNSERQNDPSDWASDQSKREKGTPKGKNGILKGKHSRRGGTKANNFPLNYSNALMSKWENDPLEEEGYCPSKGNSGASKGQSASNSKRKTQQPGNVETEGDVKHLSSFNEIGAGKDLVCDRISKPCPSKGRRLIPKEYKKAEEQDSGSETCRGREDEGATHSKVREDVIRVSRSGRRVKPVKRD